MDSLEGPFQKFMLLEDRTGSIMNKTLMGAFKNTVTRLHSFQAIRGMLFEFDPTCPSITDTVGVISCANNDHFIESCPLKDLKLLTEEEFNILRAIPSYHDRVEVCNPTPNGGKSKLQLGLEAEEGSIVEIYNTTGEVKTGIGILKSIGLSDSKNRRGTYFGVVLSDGSYRPDSSDQPKVTHIPLHRLDFMMGEAKETVSRARIKDILRGGEERQKMKSHLPVRSRVVVNLERPGKPNKVLHGTVKYNGTPTTASGEVIGVELDEKDYNATLGNYYKASKKLFDCKPHTGVIVRPDQVMKEEDFLIEKSNNLIMRKCNAILDSNEASAKILSTNSAPITSGLDKLCECPICFDMFRDPKSLHCEHHFCRDCLGELVQFNDKCVPFIRCPTCNSTHLFEDPNATLESLKCHLFVKQVLDTLQGSRKPDNNEPKCKCCNLSIRWYCADCSEYLCEKCVQSHRNKGCQKAVEARYCRGREMLLPYCSLHDCFQYYGCTTCQSTACPFCKEIQHKGHIVMTLNEYAEMLKGKLQDKIGTTRAFGEQLNKMLAAGFNVVVERRMEVVRRKCNSYLASVEKELKEKSAVVLKTEHTKWLSKLQDNENMLTKIESLQEKQNSEVVLVTSSVLQRTPDGPIDPVIVPKAWNDNDEKHLKNIFASVGELINNRVTYPIMDDLGKVSYVAMHEQLSIH